MGENETQVEQLPEFTDWKGQLGWTFTAEECRAEYYAKRSAEEFMKTFGQGKRYVTRRKSQEDYAPDAMSTEKAAYYIRGDRRVVRKGISLGILHPFRIPNDHHKYYLKKELDEFRAFIKARLPQGYTLPDILDIK